MVKRHTTPLSGLLALFRFGVLGPSRSGSVCCLPFRIWHRPHVSAPHPSGGAGTLTVVRAAVRLGLGGLDTSRHPHPVLRIGVADWVPVARESQARGRGRPRRPGATIAVENGAGAGVQATGREQGAWPRRAGAFTAAVMIRALLPG